MRIPSNKMVIILCCLIFLVFGLFNGSTGPLLSELSQQSNSSLSAVGGVLTFLFFGAFIGMLTAGPLTERCGQKIVMIVSLVLLAVGIAGFSLVRNLPLMFAFFFMAGLGQGGMEVSSNLVVSNAAVKNNTSTLNLLHFFFGLGSFAGPALVSLVISLNTPGRLVFWVAAVMFALLAVVFSLFYANQPVTKFAPADQPRPGGFQLYRSPLLWSIGVLLLAYVGIEIGVGSWSTTYMGVAASLSVEKAALVTSGYWGLLTLGRLTGVLVSRKLKHLQLLGVSITGALLGGVAFFAATGNLSPAIAAILLIGFCFGQIYPTTIAVVTHLFTKDQGKAVGIISAMASLGGLTIPWLAGLLLEKQGAKPFTLFTAAVIAVMLLAYFLSLRIRKHKNTSVTNGES